MIRKELIRRSPLRILENSTHGGVGVGNIGVFAARKGIGKTACLVHVATDRLLQDKHVIHVSFRDDPHHIISWYEDIYRELAGKYKLDSAVAIHDEIVRNRVIMNFQQDGIHITQIEKSVRSLIKNGHFEANTMVIDGYDFSRSTTAELQEFKAFAKDLGIELWFSATLANHPMESGVPKELEHVIEEVAVLVLMTPKQGFIHLNLAKDHNVDCISDLHLKLDPQVLLIAEED